MSFNSTINFFKINLSGNRLSEPKKANNDDGKVHVAMFSDFFTSYEKNPLYTNGMYEGFKEEILSSIELYRANEDIKLLVYESEPTDELTHEIVTAGFNKYINQCMRKQFNYLLNRTIIFSSFSLFGVLCIVFATSNIATNYAPWLVSCINNMGCVFLWNFLGYFAFEFFGDRRNLKRLKQILIIEYTYRQWD